MAITVHQTKYAGRDAGVAFRDVTFDSTPTAGRAVLVGVWNYNGAANLITSVTDNKSNVYTKAISHFVVGSGDTRSEAGIYHCLSIASSATFTVTVNCSGGNSNYPNIAVMEVSGLLSSGALDQTGIEEGLGGGSTTVSPSTDATTAQADELAIAAVAVPTLNVGSVDATNYTNFGEEEDGTTWMVGATSYRILSSAGVETASYTHPAASSEGPPACIATYKAATVAVSQRLTLLGVG